jgi:hypothetical protein
MVYTAVILQHFFMIASVASSAHLLQNTTEVKTAGTE